MRIIWSIRLSRFSSPQSPLVSLPFRRYISFILHRLTCNSLAHTLCYKFGYGKDFTRFKKEAMDKFSLLEDGTLDKPCTKLLLVNGTEDEIFPIDDYHLCLQHGSPKQAR